MKYYNYRFSYDYGGMTVLNKSEEKFDLDKLTQGKWQRFSVRVGMESIMINMEKVRMIEEWITEED